MQARLFDMIYEVLVKCVGGRRILIAKLIMYWKVPSLFLDNNYINRSILLYRGEIHASFKILGQVWLYQHVFDSCRTNGVDSGLW